MKVVDASAVAAVLFAEPNAEAVMERLASGRLAAPLLFSFELANICVVKSRREPDKADRFLAALGDRVGLGIEEMPVDFDEIASLALKTKLTGYDASYLWLALDLDAELVTLDIALEKAWTSRMRRENPIPPPT